MKATPQQEAAVRMHTIASDLRIALDFPSETISAFADERNGWIVGIMLGARLEDRGGPESGPHLSVDPVRFLELVHRGEHWDLDVYDLTDMADDPDEYDPGKWEQPLMTLRLTNLDGIDSMTGLVAREVVKLVNALGLKYKAQ